MGGSACADRIRPRDRCSPTWTWRSAFLPDTRCARYARSRTRFWASLDAAFETLYEGTGRQSIAPERLLRASLLQAFYSVRSERQLMEQDRLQPAVPLVRRARHRRCRLGPFGVLEEPRPAVGRGRGGEVPGGGTAPPQGRALPVGRSLLGGWHAGRGLGQLEELPCQGRIGRAAGARTQRRARFPWRKAH